VVKGIEILFEVIHVFEFLISQLAGGFSIKIKGVYHESEEFISLLSGGKIR
jgi:hypothetical protein